MSYNSQVQPDQAQPNTFNYNYETDPLYQQYQKTAMSNANKAYEDTFGRQLAATGGTMSSSALAAAGQARDSNLATLNNVIPQLYNMRRGEFENDRNFNFQRDMDNRNFDYRKKIDDRNFTLQKTLTDAQMQGYYNPYANVQIDPQVLQYAQDYQAEINRRRATPDTLDDSLIPQLEAARVQKIFSSPDLLKKYGEQYRTPDAAQQNMVRQIQEFNMQQQQQRAPLEMQMLQNQADYLPQELAMKLKEYQSRVAENYAQAGASNALRDQRLKDTDKAEGMAYEDYFKEIKGLRNEAKYDKDTGTWNKRYTDRDIYNYIKGLPIDPQSKARLAQDSGLPESVKYPENFQGPLIPGLNPGLGG
jgi:hypothetical protein